MRFVNKIGEWKGNTQRAVWINLNQLQLNYVYNNSTYPSDFSIRTDSIKKFSGQITSISVPNSVKRCFVRSWANFIHAGNKSLLWKNLKGKQNYFRHCSTKADPDLSRQLVACSCSFQQFYLPNAFHQRYLFSTCFKLENLFDVNSCGSKSCFTIEISLESVGRFAQVNVLLINTSSM